MSHLWIISLDSSPLSLGLVVFLFLKPVLSGLCLRLSGSGGPRLFFFFFRFPFVYSVVMASEVTQEHVAAKPFQPSLGLTGKAVRAASPRPGLANGPAARWGSRFPALQAAHAYCCGSPSPLGVRDCGSPRGNAAQQVGRSARRSPTWDCRHSARVEGRAERWFCLA